MDDDVVFGMLGWELYVGLVVGCDDWCVCK